MSGGRGIVLPSGTPGPDPGLPAGDRRSRVLSGGGRSTWIAVVSTIVFFAIVGFLIVSSSGWPEVRRSFFDAEEFAYAFPEILAKFWRNVFIFSVAEVLVLLFALLIAVLRSLPGPVFTPLRIMAAAYTDLFRGVPTILVIAMLGYGMPALQLRGLPDSDLFW